MEPFQYLLRSRDDWSIPVGGKFTKKTELSIRQASVPSPLKGVLDSLIGVYYCHR